jgi:hypothetical protein
MLAGALKPLTEHQTAKLLAKSPPTESTSPSRRLMSATPPQKNPDWLGQDEEVITGRSDYPE